MIGNTNLLAGRRAFIAGAGSLGLANLAGLRLAAGVFDDRGDPPPA